MTPTRRVGLVELRGVVIDAMRDITEMRGPKGEYVRKIEFRMLPDGKYGWQYWMNYDDDETLGVPGPEESPD